MSAGSVDQIRNIIFGSQMEAYENRFRSLEERVFKELGLLREETIRRFEATKEELSTERAERTEEAARDRQAHEQQLSHEVEVLNREIDKRHQKLLRLLENGMDRLKNEKTNRHDLAKLLTKMANQLSNDAKLAAKSARAGK